MHDTIIDFKCKFENSEIYTIESYECTKTIPIIDNENYISMPHYLTDDVLNNIFKIVEKYQKNIRKEVIFRGIKW